MPPWTKMLGDWTRGREKPLSGARGLEFLQALLPLACRLVRVVKLSEGIAPFAGLQNRACRKVGCQRVTVTGTFPTAPLQTARESFDLKSAFQ